MEFGSLQVIFCMLLSSFLPTSTALAAIESEDGTSIVPERFLPPRHFNYHPYTDVPQESYNFNRREQERSLQLRDHFKGNPTYNNRHPFLFSQRPKKFGISRSYDDEDEHVPKKYMFHYIVHDAGGSGDDFSHAQVHDSGATTGEYRVRLPDGRLQVVKYTADSNGYKAKVMYHNEDSVGHNQQGVTSVKIHQPTAHFPRDENNHVYYTSERGYVQQDNDPPVYANERGNIFPDHGGGFIYLVQDGRLSSIPI